MKKSYIKRTNPKRLKRLREQQFGGEYADTIRALGCCACGAPPPSVCHHTRTRGAGGTAKDMVPVCSPGCHEEIHQMGRTTFEEIYQINLKGLASTLWRRYSASGEKT